MTIQQHLLEHKQHTRKQRGNTEEKHNNTHRNTQAHNCSSDGAECHTRVTFDGAAIQ